LLGDTERIATAVVGSLEGKMKLGCLTMRDAESRKFQHRVNADQTIDTICLRCYLTAATADNEADLQELEAAHRCDSKEPFVLTGNLRSLRQH
jgi:hypothetical protein